MGDSGEGLVDAEARIQEQIEEREAERRRRSGGGPKIDPEKVREVESLRLAKSNLKRQAEAAAHPVRKQQIKLAIAEIDKRLALRREHARRGQISFPTVSRGISELSRPRGVA